MNVDKHLLTLEASLLKEYLGELILNFVCFNRAASTFACHRTSDSILKPPFPETKLYQEPPTDNGSSSSSGSSGSSGSGNVALDTDE